MIQYIVAGGQRVHSTAPLLRSSLAGSIDAGFDVKGLYGQWGHDYPDRDSGHSGLSSGRGAEAYPYTLRWDWADDLLEWFDFYLRDIGPQPRLIAEIQDNMGGWRVENTYPPDDLEWMMISMEHVGRVSCPFKFLKIVLDGLTSSREDAAIIHNL